MRILYSHRIGSRDGQAIHLEHLVAALRAMGHEVLVVGPPSYGRTELGSDNRTVSSLRQHLPGWVSEGAELAYNAPAYLRLAKAARGFRPDVIYERANLFYVAGAMLARRLGLPYILEVNSPLAQERGRFGNLRMRRTAQATERHIWRSADRVLPVTQVLADMVEAEGVARDRIVVVPNGIDLSDFEALTPRVPPHDASAQTEVVLGFVGFVRDWHGLDKVLRSLAGWDQAPVLRLDIVGDGPAREGLAALATELGIADRVRFTGLAGRDAIPRLVADFDIALQPAAVPYASPLKLFEYMAAARAIVAPDQPNIREILDHRRTALLFDPARPDALWDQVRVLAGDPALRQALGQQAREEIGRRNLTWAGNAARVTALAQEAMRAR